jgi:hypothetical protein
VHLSVQEWRPFIGGRESTGGVQWRPAHHAYRLWEGQGVALARSGHVQRCWGDVGDVMARQGDEGEREEQWPEVGVRVCASSPLPCLMARVGAEEAEDRQPGEGGIPQVWLQGRDDVGHSEIDFSGFLPTRCSI